MTPPSSPVKGARTTPAQTKKTEGEKKGPTRFNAPLKLLSGPSPPDVRAEPTGPRPKNHGEWKRNYNQEKEIYGARKE